MERILSFLLALVMCLSLVPEAALAQKVGETETVFKETAEETAASEAAETTSEETPPEETTPEETTPEETTPEETTPEETTPAETAEDAPRTEEPEAIPTEETTEMLYTLIITEEPEDTLLLEGAAFFFVSAAVCQEGAVTEGLPRYQWQNFDGEGWTDIPDQTDQVLVLEALTEEDIGSQYRCRVTFEALEAVSRSAAITGLAEGEEEGDWDTDVYINPVYEDVLAEEDLPQVSSAEVYGAYTRYSSPEEAAKAMRQALLNRQSSFSTEFYLENDTPAVPGTFMRSIYYMAVAHTGVPTEGDYLHFEFGGYRGNYKWDDKTRIFQCTYNFLYYTTAAQEKKVDAEVTRLLEALELDGKTPKQKVDAIYDYLCSTVTYDYQNLNDKSHTLKYTAYGALIDHTAVCQGYATAFYRLCLECGVDAREISSNAMNHAWNIVKLGSFYYCLDATWDANHQDNYLYYLKGRTDWQTDAENGRRQHKMGDEFDDSAFEESYAVPEENYEEITSGFTLLEGGTLVLKNLKDQKIANYRAAMLDGCLTTAAPWREMAEDIRRIEFPEGVTYIGSNAFRGLRNLEELVIPKTVQTIESGAFEDCVSLKELTIPYGVDTIGSRAFRGLTNLRTLEIPESVRSIGSGAFQNCMELKTLTIRSGADLGSDAFSGCGIETLSIPAEWNAYGLKGCLEHLETLIFEDDGYMASYSLSTPAPWSGTGVKTVRFDSRLQKIGSYALRSCRSLKTLELPRNLRILGAGALEDCVGLTELTLPESLTQIQSDVFSGCTGLKTLTFTGSALPSLNASAFREAALTCVYPCTWKTLPEGNFGGEVKWKGDHSLEYVFAIPVTGTSDGTAAHWKCTLCGRLYEDESCEQELSSEDVILYRETYPISYENLEDGENPNPGSYPRAKGLELKDGERKGYIFEGWYEDSGFRQRIRSIPAHTHGELTLYAKWTAIQYTLAFHSNGGSGSASKAVLGYAQETTLPDTGFRRTGYTFSGWNREKDGSGEEFSMGQTVSALTEKNKETVTLYAQWTPIVYTLRLNPNDGVTEAEEIQVPYGENFEFPGELGSKQGHHLTQWTDKPNGSGSRYAVGKTAKNLSSTAKTLTFYGKWEVNSYTVVFHSNGTTAKDRKQTFTYGRTAALSGNGFSRTGYVFAGWSSQPDGEKVYDNKEKVTSLTAEQNGVVDLYARWTPITYKVVLKLNGADGEIATREWTYDELHSLPEMTAQRPGFTFLGWGTSASGKVLYEPEQEVRNLASTQGRTVTLYALWKANSYEIHFDGNGNTGGSTRSMTKLLCGRTYTLNANGFKKTNYDFAGWKDADTGKIYQNKQRGMNFVLEDGGVLELEAQWVLHPYTITYKNCVACDENPNSPKYDAETQVDFVEPTRPGATFLGWYLDSRCTKPIESTQGHTGDLTVYAKWENGGRGYGYTIVFDGSGAASGKTNPMTGRWNGTVYTLNSNGFKRPGYTFLGWSLEEDAEKPTWTNRARVGNLAEQEGQTVVLYAVWTPNTYKITYQKLVTADGNPNPPTFTVEDTVVLQDPQRPGCDFLGWYLESSYRTKVEEITPGFKADNLTLYAKWSNSGKGYGYTIAFDGNGAASGKMNPMTGRYNGMMYALNSNGFQRPGYTFLGWSLDKNAQTPTWTNRAKVGNLAQEQGQIVTLYAVWRKQ